MSGTLATVNGEALAVPGLTFWGKRIAWGNDTRLALICSDDRGAVELWTNEKWMRSADRTYRELGGVEIHARRPLHDFMTRIDDCAIVPGGCWADGSSLAYSKQFLPLIERGQSEAVLNRLAEWHVSHFGQVEAAHS